MITVFWLRNAKLQVSYHLYIFCTKSEKDAFFLNQVSAREFDFFEMKISNSPPLGAHQRLNFHTTLYN